VFAGILQFLAVGVSIGEYSSCGEVVPGIWRTTQLSYLFSVWGKNLVLVFVNFDTLF